MPLHSIQHLATGADLGLWQLRETSADLWPLLPDPATYRSLLPHPATPARQAQWLAGRVLVHQLLAASKGSSCPSAAAQLRNDAAGRPLLAGRPGAALSLSHSGEWVAALLAPSGQAGIDIELIRDKARRLAPRFLSAAEQEFADRQGNDPALFSLLWSAKETLYKLAGQRGLSFRRDLLTASFAWPTATELVGTVREPAGQTRHRVCYTPPAPGYVLTYCHEPANFSRTSLIP